MGRGSSDYSSQANTQGTMFVHMEPQEIISVQVSCKTESITCPPTVSTLLMDNVFWDILIMQKLTKILILDVYNLNPK